jgi:hypothetical protein
MVEVVNEFMGSISNEDFLNQQRDCWPLKKDSTLSRYIVSLFVHCKAVLVLSYWFHSTSTEQGQILAGILTVLKEDSFVDLLSDPGQMLG